MWVDYRGPLSTVYSVGPQDQHAALTVHTNDNTVQITCLDATRCEHIKVLLLKNTDNFR